MNDAIFFSGSFGRVDIDCGIGNYIIYDFLSYFITRVEKPQRYFHEILSSDNVLNPSDTNVSE